MGWTTRVPCCAQASSGAHSASYLVGTTGKVARARSWPFTSI